MGTEGKGREGAEEGISVSTHPTFDGVEEEGLRDDEENPGSAEHRQLVEQKNPEGHCTSRSHCSL
jgi:hypothetical protein